MKEEEDFTDSKEVPIEQGRENTMARNKERNNDGKTTTFKENNTFEIPVIFPPKLPNPGSFSIPCIVGKVEIERHLCDLGASVSIMPYSLFHKLQLGPLLAAPFSLQLSDGSMM